MRILIVADVYPPEVSSAANLMQELAEGLTKRGHKVAVATSYPKHYLTTEGAARAFNIFSVENGVEVIRVKTLPLHKVNFVIRGISQLTIPFLFFNKVKKFIKGKIDAVIVYSPPLPLALIGDMVKRRYGAKFILNIQDIFPQNAVDLGILKNKFLIKFFEDMEKEIYRSADKITFHSEGGRRFLIEKKNVPPDKIITMHNWVDLDSYRNLAKNISFRKEYNLEGKFIFLFAGILGPAQGLEFLLDVAQKTADLKDVVFLLVGDGMEKDKIEKIIKERFLTNVVVKPFVSKEDYSYLVKDADVGVVCLSIKNKTPFIPGKFLGYMAAAKPILAFLNKESDAFALTEETNCGYAVQSDNLEEAVAAARKMYAEKEKLPQLGRNGFVYAENNLALDVCLAKIEKILS
ncbi:MAG: glycosyltransferase family 4 protein [Candidatus Paceibacterota bacterium]